MGLKRTSANRDAQQALTGAKVPQNSMTVREIPKLNCSQFFMFYKAASRCFASQSNASLIGALRKLTPVSIAKAKDALQNNNFNIEQARKWLMSTEVHLKSAEKLQSRITSEGLLSIVKGPEGAVMIELNSESDFVSKSLIFCDLAIDVATSSIILNKTVSYTESIPLDKLLDKNINDKITKAIGTLGENIKLRRGILYPNTFRSVVGFHCHSAQSLPGGLGRIGTLVRIATTKELITLETVQVEKIAKKIAQHITGFAPDCIEEGEGGEPLLNQPFLFGGGTVGEFLERECMVVMEFTRWEIGEGLEKKVENFAEEVAKQMRG